MVGRCVGGLQVREVSSQGVRQAWSRFRGDHYLTGDLHRAARVFLTYADGSADLSADSGGDLSDQEHGQELEEETGQDRGGELVGFFSLLPVAGHRGWWRGHRTVVLPDHQGPGIGNAMIEATAEQLWQRERKRFRATTAARSLIAHRRQHPDIWRLAMAPKMKAVDARRSWACRPRPGGSP